MPTTDLGGAFCTPIGAETADFKRVLKFGRTDDVLLFDLARETTTTRAPFDKVGRRLARQPRTTGNNT